MKNKKMRESIQYEKRGEHHDLIRKCKENIKQKAVMSLL